MKTKRQKLRVKADRMIQNWVRATYKSCLLCGRPCSVGHHFVRTANCLATRYFKPNLIPLCAHCHQLIHCQPAIPTAQIARIKGDKWLDDILKARKKEVRDTAGFYQQAIKDYEQEDNS